MPCRSALMYLSSTAAMIWFRRALSQLLYIWKVTSAARWFCLSFSISAGVMNGRHAGGTVPGLG
eukprot:10598933-Ditylum_brightwellii.AAC.1